MTKFIQLKIKKGSQIQEIPFDTDDLSVVTQQLRQIVEERKEQSLKAFCPEPEVTRMIERVTSILGIAFED